jgi:pimeloyl-ACP methyl ester carboxylesterase
VEKEIKIRTGDSFAVQGVLTMASKERSKKLLVLVHGLTGFKNEHIFYNGAAFFAKKGFDVFRFDFYSGGRDSRKLSKSTLRSHASDLNRVVRHFDNYEKIFLVGHSLGGLTVLLADLNNVRGIVLWDPSGGLDGKLTGILNYCRYIKSIQIYILDWGVETVIGRRMYEEWKHTPSPREIMEGVNVPIEIINAGKGVLKRVGGEYFKWAKKPKRLVVIKNAGHTFDEEGSEKKLFGETFNWIKRF